VDPVGPDPIQRVKAAPVLLTFAIMVVALLLVLLGVLAANHAEIVPNESRYTVPSQLVTTYPPTTVNLDVIASEFSVGHVRGLATGCIVLIMCCTVGLALLAAGAWRAELFRRLAHAVQLLQVRSIGAIPARLGGGTRPCLIVLSISRT